jgi:hypothetical protein
MSYKIIEKTFCLYQDYFVHLLCNKKIRYEKENEICMVWG